jgi:hypothetical protein
MVKRKAVLIALVAVGVILLGYIAWTLDLGALQKPSRAETFLATKAKHWLVARAVSREKLTEPSPVSLSEARGRSLFMACCSMCLDQLSASQVEGKAQSVSLNAGAT